MKAVNRFLVICGLLGGSLGVVAQEQDKVPLFLTADSATPVIMSVYKDDPMLKTAAPDEANPLFYRLEYTKDYTGYIEGSTVGFGNKPEEGTPVYMEPNTESAVLTTIEAVDEVSFTELSDWTEITIRKPLPLYFQASWLRETAPPPPPAVDIARYYEGWIVKSTGFFSAPPYEYELRDHRGNRIAYLDVSALVLHYPLEQKLKQHVRIYGVCTPLGKELVIQARTLQ
ncbi:MAG: hypothetical protein JW739_04545 [Opitutales bacterium]|nr:hypothetical protein [Opitutales bacterium]